MTLAVTPEVVPVGQLTITELADAINAGHAEVRSGLSMVMAHAIKVGELLLEVQERLEWGEFQAWAQENVRFGAGTYARYMTLAKYQDHLPKELLTPTFTDAGREDTGIAKAILYLRQNGMRRDTGAPRRADWEEVRRLHAQGLSQNKIAALLGTSQVSVSYALMSTSARKAKADKKRRQRKERARALRIEAAAKDLRAISDDLGEAYSLLRKCAQRLQKAHDTAGDHWIRKSLAAALADIHHAEDHLTTASRNKK